ncbi:MAG: hypothetical protein KF830_12920 [Planctomycetes bacterium]|nr:hypothetical protein [Planctomycetota bacterium]
MSFLLGSAAMAQAQKVYATHDSTAGSGGIEPIDAFREAWADVKSPGDGRQYAVGTVEVRTTENATFSGSDAEPLTVAFDLQVPGQKRQVVLVQCTEAQPYDAAAPGAFQEIVWQKYFYGSTGDFLVLDRATNARAIAVWPTGDPATTRVAICGETYDQQVPGTEDSFLAATAVAPTGFLAVLDGAGVLLWTHHLYGVDPEQSCAVTDLSIRVEADGLEVVTYCGISTHGDPGSGTTLSAKYPAAGSSATAGVWGGFVGRVSRDTVGTKDVEFHSDISLGLELGLFGLAEIDVDYAANPPVDRFAVVGALRVPGTPGQLGLVCAFEASAVRSSGSLIGEPITTLGTVLGESHTLARDVLVLRDGYYDAVASTLRHAFVVVGSTTDADLFDPEVWVWAQPAPLAGGVDGFVCVLSDDPPGPLPLGGQFCGGPGDDGATGVQGWNEYPDHFAVATFTQGPAGTGSLDFGVSSYYLVSDAIGVSPTGIRTVRTDQIGGTADERPAAMGALHALVAGTAFEAALLGDPAGGGIAVDQRARVNVVGCTPSTNFLAGFPGFPSIAGRGRDAAPPADAVRVVLDMLPPPRSGQSFGIGRTDLSGDQGPFVLPAGLTGGTTPACALSPFGRRIGDPAPVLARMLLDYEGDQPMAVTSGPPVDGAILISRPSSLVFTAWQFEVPGAGSSGAPGLVLSPPLINGVEVFTPDAFVNGTVFFASVGLPGHAVRVPVNFVFPSLPAPAPAMTVQVFCWFPNNPQPGGLTCTGSDTTEVTASAAMWLPL